MLPRVTNFNSIKVQLEPAGTQAGNGNLSSFQFHKGTIRTSTLLRPWMDGTYFNSIKVQLEPNKAYFMKRLDDYFNSIKVQLEQGWLR